MSFKIESTKLDQSYDFPSSNQKKTEVNSDLRPSSIQLDASQNLSPDRIKSLNAYVQKMKNKLENFVSEMASEAEAADPAEQEKIDRRDKCLAALAYVPAIGTGISVFKEKAVADKLKVTFDPAERQKLLKKQKDLRLAALIRTVISVALAILLIAVAIFTGGASAAIGLGLMGGVLALGSGFAGYWASQMIDSKRKLKVLESKEGES